MSLQVAGKKALVKGRMIPYKNQYKQLLKRIYRLPVEKVTLTKLVQYTKTKFTEGDGPNSSLYKSSIDLLDDILVKWKLVRLTEVLDKVYSGWKLKLVLDFDKVHYLQLKPYWPYAHLINEFGTQEDVVRYHDLLSKEKIEDFSTVEHFGFNKPEVSIDLIKTYEGSDVQYKDMVEELKKIYKVYYDHQGKLMGKKVPPFEAIYPTNRTAGPVHPTVRDQILHDQISLTKNLVRLYKPVEEADLDYLRKFAIHKPSEPGELDINPNFFKYMMNTKHNASTAVQKARTKHLVPSDNNIRKIYREYVRTRFYRDKNGDYKMSWLKDFWQNEQDRQIVKDSLGSYYEDLEDTDDI